MNADATPVESSRLSEGGAEPTLAERLREARVAAFLNGPAEHDGDGEGSAETHATWGSLTSGSEVPSALDLERLVHLAGQLYAAAVTEETRQTYARRWASFGAWCDEHGMTSLPATTEVLMLYLSYGAQQSHSAATLQGRAAAINRVHLEAGETPPGAGPSMRLFWKGLQRTLPTSPAAEITALRIAGLREVCRVIDATAVDPVEQRDCAILGLLSAGASATEIANLTWDAVRARGRALAVTLRPHRGRIFTRDLILQPRINAETGRNDAACPVQAMSAWRDHTLAQQALPTGTVFCSFDQRCEQGEPLDGKAVAQVRRQRLATLGERPGVAATIEKAMSLLGDRHPIDLRDKAMLTVGFAGAMRRGEVTRLRWSDLRLTEHGLMCRLRRTKTNMDGRRVTQVGIPYGRSEVTCPVTAFLAWRTRVEAQVGPLDPEGWVFTTAGRRGRAVAIGHTPITPETLTRVVTRRAQQAGLSGHWGGRSLRAGFISTAADLDIPLEAIATQSRHKTLDNLAVYIRDSDPFRRNPAARIGL